MFLNKKIISIALVMLISILSSFGTNAAILKLATLNCEFLNTKKVHIKYGGKFAMKDNSAAFRATWTESYRNSKFKEATAEVAVIREINADTRSVDDKCFS